MSRGDDEGEVQFSNGDVYRGDLSQGVCQGLGEIWYKNGDYYEGAFENGKRHGKGAHQFHKSGDLYWGDWQDDQITGFGRMRYKAGGTRCEHWFNGKPCKDGALVYSHRHHCWRLKKAKQSLCEEKHQ